MPTLADLWMGLARLRSSELEQCKAKLVFEAQLALANEHSTINFNAAMPTRSRSAHKKTAPRAVF